MGSRLVVLTSPRLTREVRKVAQMKLPDTTFRIMEATLVEAVERAKELETSNEVDAIITGGANARLIRNVVRLPVVELAVTGFDLLEAVSAAAAYGPVVPVITFGETEPNLSRVMPILNVSVKSVTYHTGEQLVEELEGLYRQGFRAVVGSSLVCDMAERAGLKGFLIYSYETIYSALQVGAEIVRTKQMEAEKAERLRAILKFAYSGILSTDEEGRITAFNPMAEHILGVPARNAIGQKASQLLPYDRLEEVITGGRPVMNQVQKLLTGPVLVNWVPISVANKVRGVVATFQDSASIQRAEHKIRRSLAAKGLSAQYNFSDIIAESQAMRAVVEKARHYAQADSTILVMGETGTGKELLAQSIHNASRRRHDPFVAVNCAALPETLLESELFGYDEGAFTGARRGGKPGLFELAHGGTIFLDEIGEISPVIQARLLRVLQERQIMRIGSERVIPIDIRVIAATNRDLEAEVAQNRFRADLFYRLNVLRIGIPPLRDRGEDILNLTRAMLSRHDPKLAELISGGLPGLQPLMLRHSWPGNVRELENLIERFVVMLGAGEKADSFGHRPQLPDPEAVIRAWEAELRSALPSLRDQHGQPQTETVPRPSPPSDGSPVTLMRSPWEPVPMEGIIRALAEVGGNRAKAARLLGISRTTLYRRLEKPYQER